MVVGWAGVEVERGWVCGDVGMYVGLWVGLVIRRLIADAVKVSNTTYIVLRTKNDDYGVLGNHYLLAEVIISSEGHFSAFGLTTSTPRSMFRNTHFRSRD